MSVKLIEERIKQYKLQSDLEEVQAFKEIFQELALASLSRSKLFRFAAFRGGTALRTLHKLSRFSEDLDFVLLKNDPNFTWQHFLKDMHLEFEAYGLSLKIKEPKEDLLVKRAFIKEASLIKTLSFQTQKIQIKLEMDTAPPPGSTYETHFLEFPYPFSINSQDLPSLFSGKMHALLCRPYTKGRDWYDLVWYVSRKTIPNWTLLKSSLEQQGCWKDQPFVFTKEWTVQILKNKIEGIHWQQVLSDIRPFLRLYEQNGLEVWGKDFFLALVEKILHYT